MRNFYQYFDAFASADGLNEKLKGVTYDSYKLPIRENAAAFAYRADGFIPPLCSIVMSRPRLLELENGNSRVNKGQNLIQM